MLLDAPGTPVPPETLKIAKAKALFEYLVSGRHAYASVLDTRRDAATATETVVFVVVIEVSQDRANPIFDQETLAASFNAEDDHFPEVLALRADFPWVPHLNQRESEFPRSLCLYELPYQTIKLRWTPTTFLERIRQWLSLSAAGRLHQDDQPLENVFLGPFPPLILPSDFLHTISHESTAGQGITRFGVHAVGNGPGDITGFVVTNPKIDGGQVRGDHIATAIIAPPQKHGIIRNTPRTLRDLIDVMQQVNVDLLGLLRGRIRSWRDGDASVIGSRLVLILIFPKLRDEGAVTETWEWWGFLLLDTIREIGAKIGVWEITNDGTLATLIGAGEDKSSEVAIQIANPVTQLTKGAAAKFNGTQADERRFVLVGVGALGSMSLMNLLRKGFGSWSVIDDDLMMPHNGARHALPAVGSGIPKVTGMKQITDMLYEESVIVVSERANVLRPGPAKTSLTTIFETADVIVDCSADVAAARYIALDVPGNSRRLSLFLSPNAEQLVLLLEDTHRQIRLDALEMQFYRMILTNELLKDHYFSAGKTIRYGRSCRDLSAILSADAIAMFSAVSSRAIERLLHQEQPTIVVWKAEPDLSVSAFQVEPRGTFSMAVGDFTVCWDEGLVEKLRWLRGEKLPKETGGALVGCWDLSRSILYLVDITGAPQDSVERPTAFIRGSKDLSTWIDVIASLTGKAVEYVGEWHSHPEGHPTNPSGDDRQVFQWIDEHLSIDGLPALMLIAGDAELRWIWSTKGDGEAWKYPN